MKRVNKHTSSIGTTQFGQADEADMARNGDKQNVVYAARFLRVTEGHDKPSIGLIKGLKDLQEN